MMMEEGEDGIGDFGVKLWHGRGFTLGFLLHPALIFVLVFVATLMASDALMTH